MNRKISLGAAIAYMAIVAILAFGAAFFTAWQKFESKVNDLSERSRMYEKIEEIDKFARQYYFGDIDEDQLMSSIAGGYVSGLGDRYGLYLTAEQYSRQSQDYDGKTADIGVSVVKDPSGYIKIIEVYPDSSAYTAGMVKGDIIVEVEETSVNNDNIDLMISALKGEAGTKVKIVVRRDSEDIPLEITRRKVEAPMVTSAQYGEIGYLLIKEFNNNTPDHFIKELDKLLEKDIKAIVFDVRNNPGGTIDSVATILDRLLPEGDIVSATYKDGTTEVLAVSDDKEVALPMVVITNQRSASAAELFAQAIKDYNKGRTVGTLTYGKGLMQRIYQLRDGSALDITIAKYNPPKSPNFDGVGVKPDYEVKMSAELEKIYYELDENSDPQLKKALELANAVVKTGGFDTLTPDSSSSAPDETKDD